MHVHYLLDCKAHKEHICTVVDSDNVDLFTLPDSAHQNLPLILLFCYVAVLGLDDSTSFCIFACLVFVDASLCVSLLDGCRSGVETGKWIPSSKILKTQKTHS